MDWARILAYITGTVGQSCWNEYLAAENRILTAQLKGRLKLLSVAERATLGEIGHRLGSHGEQELGLGL
jgi:putative transposase